MAAWVVGLADAAAVAGAVTAAGLADCPAQAAAGWPVCAWVAALADVLLEAVGPWVEVTGMADWPVAVGLALMVGTSVAGDAGLFCEGWPPGSPA